MTTFADLGLSETLLRAVSAEGHSTPTPIQAAVIPAALAGRDILGIAQTGTGKTAAFVLPILQQLEAARRVARKPRTGRALILTPTRELATQIADGIRRYGRNTKLTSTVVVGGVKPGPQVRALGAGVDIIVATPGRLLDHLASGAVELSATHTVVLDEADQMLDLGFFPAIRRLMAAVPKQRQTMLLSATMPAEIRKLAAQFQTDPAEIAVAQVSRPIEQIAQSVIEVDAAAKRDVLAHVLSDEAVTRAIVFVRTKHGADKVARNLVAAGLPAGAIHGNKSQNQRQRALDDFRTGETPILVATDIAARGIHVDDVSHVVNYELPEVAEVYVHRIGRTARAGRSGIAVTLCDPSERKLLHAIERLTGIRIARDTAVAAAVPVRASRPAQGTAPAPARHAGGPRPHAGSSAEARGPDHRGGDPRGGDHRGGDHRGGDHRGGDHRGGDNRADAAGHRRKRPSARPGAPAAAPDARGRRRRPARPTARDAS